MSSIRNLAVAEGMMVIATIHQPSLETLAQFTNLLMLSEGKTCFLGKVDELEGFFEKWGRPVHKFVSCPSWLLLNMFFLDLYHGSDSNLIDCCRPPQSNTP